MKRIIMLRSYAHKNPDGTRSNFSVKGNIFVIDDALAELVVRSGAAEYLDKKKPVKKVIAKNKQLKVEE